MVSSEQQEQLCYSENLALILAFYELDLAVKSRKAELKYIVECSRLLKWAIYASVFQGQWSFLSLEYDILSNYIALQLVSFFLIFFFQCIYHVRISTV